MFPAIGEGDDPDGIEIVAVPAQRIFAQSEGVAQSGYIGVLPHHQLQAVLRYQVGGQVFGFCFIELAVDGHRVGHGRRGGGLKHTILRGNGAGLYRWHIDHQRSAELFVDNGRYVQRPVEALAVEVAAGCIFLAMADDDDREIVLLFPALAAALKSDGQQEENK